MNNVTNIIGTEISNSHIELINKFYDTKKRKIVKNIKFGITDTKLNVIGRKEEVDELYFLLKAHGRVVITGIGGIGKTSLAMYCGEKWIEDKLIDHVAVINSDSEVSLEKSFKGLAADLNIDKLDHKMLDSVVNEIFNIFDESKLLLIYDNVENYCTIGDFLPSLKRNIFILCTSQITEYDKDFFQYRLRSLSLENSLELFLSRLGNFQNLNDQLEDIKSLINTFDYHPLALIQAATYINKKRCYTIEMYLKEYTEILLNPKLKNTYFHKYKKTVYTALLMNINLIKEEDDENETAKKILYCSAYLNPDFIDKDIFNCYGNHADALELLERYSLIEVATYFFSIHRLLQEVIKKYVDIINFPVEQYLNSVLEVLINHDYYTLDFHSYYLLPYLSKKCINMTYFKIFNNMKNDHHNLMYLNALQSRTTDINTDDWTAGHYAAFMDYRSTINILYEMDILFDHQSQWTILHCLMLSVSYSLTYKFSSSNNYVEYIKNIIIKHNIINSKLSNGYTPLHIAAIVGNENFVSTLIDWGCNVNLTDKGGNTAAHYAAKYGFIHILKILVKHSDFNQKNNEGKTVTDVCEETFVFCIGRIHHVEHFIELPKMLIYEDRKNFLQNMTGSDEEVGKIIDMFQNIKIALQMVMLYIKKKKITAGEFLKIFHEENINESKFDSCLKFSQNAVFNVIKILFLIYDLLIKDNLVVKILLLMLYVEETNLKMLHEYLLNVDLNDISASIDKIKYWNLLEDCFFFRLTKIVKFTLIQYMKERMNLTDICKNILKCDCTVISDKSIALSYLTSEDIEEFYERKYENNINKIQTLVDNKLRNNNFIVNLENWSLLHYAGFENDFSVFKCLIDSGIIEKANNDILHLSVLAGEIDFIKKIINSNMDNINIKMTGNNFTPLHLVPYRPVIYEQDTVLKILMDRGADINARTEDGRTIVHLAVIECMTHLISDSFILGANINMADNNGDTPLHLCCKIKDFYLFNILCHPDYNSDINIKNNMGETPLDIYVKEHDKNSIIKKLVKHYLPFNNIDNWEAHHFAAYDNLEYVYKRTFKNTNLPCGVTPLHLSAIGVTLLYDDEEHQNPELETLVHLLEHTSPNVETTNKITPLHVAAIAGNITYVYKLSGAGAALNCKSDKQETPLHFAVFNARIEIVEFLLGVYDNTDVNTITVDGNTALHLAASDSELIVKILLEKNVSIDLQNNYKQTALHVAVINNKIEIVDMLLKNGANISIVDDNNKTAKDLAVDNKYSDIVKAISEIENICPKN